MPMTNVPTPLTLQAKKAVDFELWEQPGRIVPDAVLITVDGVPTLSALVKGVRELKA